MAIAKIERFLRLMNDRGASDFHLTVGRPPMVRALVAGSSSTPSHRSPSQIMWRTGAAFSPMPPANRIASAPSIAARYAPTYFRTR